QLVMDDPALLSEPPGEPEAYPCVTREHGQRDQGELPVRDEQHHNDARDRSHIHRGVHEGGAYKVLGGGDVARYARYDLADALAVEETQAHALHVMVQIAAQIEDQAMPCEAGQIRAPVTRDPVHHVDSDEDRKSTRLNSSHDQI